MASWGGGEHACLEMDKKVGYLKTFHRVWLAPLTQLYSVSLATYNLETQTMYN